MMTGGMMTGVDDDRGQPPTKDKVEQNKISSILTVNKLFS